MLKLSVKRALGALICVGFLFVSISESATAKASDTKVIVENFGERISPEYSMSNDGTVIAIAYLKEGMENTLSAAISQNGGSTWQFLNDFAKKARVFNFKVKVSEDGSDITFIWVENRANLSSPGTSGELWFKQSTDRGNSWSQNQLISTPDVGGRGLHSTIQNGKSFNFSQSRDGKTKLLTFYARSVISPDFPTAFLISSFNSGRTWSVASNNKYDIRQPYGDTFVSSDGSFIAYAYENYGNKETQRQLRFSSTINGINWSEERVIDVGNTYDPSIQFVSLKGSDFAIYYDSSNAFLISKDKGKSFEKIQTPVDGWGTKVWISEDKSRLYISTVVLPFSNGHSVRFAYSKDYGKNWIQVLNLNQGVDYTNTLSTSRDGRIIGLLTTGWGANKDLFLQISGDYGRSWSHPKKINGDGNYFMQSFDRQEIPMQFDERTSQILILANIQNPTLNSFSQQIIKILFYKIEFDGNLNTSGSAPSQLISMDGSEVLIPATSNKFTKKNHTFIGWSKSRNDISEILLPRQTISNITSDIKLFAVWRAEVSKKITITCTKGKLIKKITDIKPKCPSGFKKA
jgi:hypothetical protein